MAENEDKSKIPYFMLENGNNDCEDYTSQYQGPGFDYNNYQNNYRNNQYNNAYGNFFGGYDTNCGFNQNFPQTYPGLYGFPPFQHPPGPPQASQGPQESQEPQGPPDSSCNVSGQEFGKNGPPVKKKLTGDKIIKALILESPCGTVLIINKIQHKGCGIPKDNLKNLPRNLLKLYHPEFCGLCSQSFDTMNMSRMHYICKNHLKNQKKWLSQQTDSGFRRNKEQPLKARDLYCEICDVHITSKAHSESHYAGKPHKAIVEGRKNPKNPFLMQRGMEDRLEQLIRREKKHLRPGEDVQTDRKETKAMQPQLCCQICDTSVTCSDQMIMHLNGKRHLAKEKQHILKMMKGGGDRDSCTTELDKGRYASKREEEKYEFVKRPDSWDQLRNKISLTSA